MSLSESIITGRKLSPLRLLVHGKPGAGKTTFLSELPNPLFLDLEKGFGDLETARYQAEDLGEIKTAIRDLNLDSMGYKSLVVDSFSRLLEYVSTSVADSAGVKSPADIAFGKGYAAVDAEIVNVLKLLDNLRENKNMHIAFTAHSDVKTFSPPDSDPYDRYEIKGKERFSAPLIEWCDVILFLKEEVFVTKDNRATGTGKRVLISEDRPTHIAKSRYNIPAEIVFTRGNGWKSLVGNLKGAKKAPVKTKEPATVHVDVNPQNKPVTSTTKTETTTEQQTKGEA